MQVRSGPCVKPFPQFGKDRFVREWRILELSRPWNCKLSHRMAGGFYLQGTYDLAKDLSDAGDMPSGFGTESGNGRVDDRFNLRNDRGNDPGPRRQRFLFTGLYQLPFGHGRQFLANANRFVNGALGGWQLSAILLDRPGLSQPPMKATGH